MTCLEMFERLDRYHAGELSSSEAAAVEQHLLGCEACRADFHFQRTLKSEVAALPREIPAPASVWAGIEQRVGIQKVSAKPLAWWQRRSMLAAAAVVLVTLTASLTALLVREPGPAGGGGTFQVTQAAYEQAAAELARTLEISRKELSPEAWAVVQRNLEIIDEAIRETQKALSADPGNERVAELLWASWEKKIDLLERAAQHAES